MKITFIETGEYEATLLVKTLVGEFISYADSVNIKSKDNFEKAEADFQKAIELDPGDYDCLFDIYRSLEKNGYQEAGIIYLQDALASGEEEVRVIFLDNETPLGERIR